MGRARPTACRFSFDFKDLPTPWLHAMVHDHLTAKERLSLFRVSRGSAAVVMQHAPSRRLIFMPSNKGAKNEQQRLALEAFLATAPAADLQVDLGGIYADGEKQWWFAALWAGEVKQRVTHLTLDCCYLTADVLQIQLQLQHCHRLRQLALQGVIAWPDEEGLLQHLQQPSRRHLRFLPPSLTELQADNAVASVFLRFLAPQLTHLVCGGLPQPLPMLSHLTHIRVKYLSDSVMDLAKLPSLTHVTAKQVYLSSSHTQKQLRWQQLKLLGCTVDPSWLRPLPLHRIQQLHLDGSVICKDLNTAQQDIAHLASCPNLQCVPRKPPSVSVPGYLEFSIFHRHPRELVMLCANSMTAAGGLLLGQLQFPALQQLLPCIPQLPHKVTMLRLRFNNAAQQVAIEQRVQVLQQLVGALPQHIKHLVIEHNVDLPDDTRKYAAAVVKGLQGCKKATKLVVAFGAHGSIPVVIRVLAGLYPHCISCINMNE